MNQDGKISLLKLPNPDKPRGINQNPTGQAGTKKRKLKAHPDTSGQRRKEYAKNTRLCVKSLLFGI